MRFVLTRTSDWSGKGEEVEIDSIEELLALAEREGKDLIIKRFNLVLRERSSVPEIEVYDSWRE